MHLVALRIAALVLGALTVPAASLRAQAHSGSAPRRGWVTVGVGAAVGPEDAFATTLGGSYSVGAAIVTARFDRIGNWEGKGMRDKALLAGLRTASNTWFASATVGVARTDAFRACECGDTDQGRATVLAFEAKGFHACEAASSSLSVYGTIGPRRHRYVAVTLSGDFGWFGPSR